MKTLETDISTVALKKSWLESFKWLSSFFSRKDTANSIQKYITGLLSKVEKKNSWQLSEAMGYTDPYCFQHLLGRASWDCDAIRNELAVRIVETLGQRESVLCIDETGFLKKGQSSAGVARQYSGTAGRIENCQIGVFLSYSTPKGHTLIDRELYFPKEWFNDDKKLERVVVEPEKVKFKTKIELAQEMLDRCFNLGVHPDWVTADSVYGGSGRLRFWLEDQGQSYVMAVASNHYVTIDFRQIQVRELVESSHCQWTILPAGHGTKGSRTYLWTTIEINHPYDHKVSRWLLCRKSVKDSTTTYYVAFGHADTSLEKLALVAGKRWTIEECFKTAKGETGLDQYQVRSRIGWFRHITLAMVAQAILVISRSCLLEMKNVGSSMHEFKKKRGLLSD